jgi:hypothetical protein
MIRRGTGAIARTGGVFMIEVSGGRLFRSGGKPVVALDRRTGLVTISRMVIAAPVL